MSAGLALGFDKPVDESAVQADPRLIGMLASVPLIDRAGATIPTSALANKILGIYFGADWCPPCHKFCPMLVATYQELKRKGEDFEVVFVSSDRDQAGFDSAYGRMPWLAIPFASASIRQAIAQVFQVSGIPTLVLLRPDGRLITVDGREAVMSDPNGAAFPWDAMSFAKHMQSVGPKPLPTHHGQLLRMACDNFSLKVTKEVSSGRLDIQAVRYVHDMFVKIRELVCKLPGGLSFIDDSHLLSLPEALMPDTGDKFEAFANVELFADTTSVEKYAGDPYEVKTSTIASLIDLPTTVTSLTQAIDTIVLCEKLVLTMLDRAQDGSISSRLALQYQVLEFIAEVFTSVIPMPARFRHAPDSSTATPCIWLQPVASARQNQGLQAIYRLSLIYGQTWQSISLPTRSFDSERCLVAVCLLVAFDALIRSVATDAPLLTSALLAEDGVYSVSTTVCQDSRLFDKVGASCHQTITLQLIWQFLSITAPPCV
jgi:thiol-disulfide isomerase/thioredoxin